MATNICRGQTLPNRAFIGHFLPRLGAAIRGPFYLPPVTTTPAPAGPAEPATSHEPAPVAGRNATRIQLGCDGPQRRCAGRPQRRDDRREILSDHPIHGYPQPAGTHDVPNRPYEPCCRRNHDEAARGGKGGEKSAGADQPIANASTDSRENKMRTMMGSYGGRQRCHRQRRRQRQR